MPNIIYVLIEFIDELIFGVTESVWPLIKMEMSLTYTQVGILLTVPAIFTSILEPILGVLGDIWKRRLLILGGGVAFTLALFLIGISSGFYLLLIGLTIFYPASAAYVSLSQANMMDSDPTRHEKNMARWTFSGSLGVVLGPPFLIGVMAVGFGWRGAFFILFLLSIVLFHFSIRNIKDRTRELTRFPTLRQLVTGFHDAVLSLKLPGVSRWLILLQFSDLMLDVLLGFLALYFTDVVGLKGAEAAGAVLIWLVFGLVGDFLLIPLLEKLDGLVYLFYSAILETLLFVAFLVVDIPSLKLTAVGLLGFFNSGWYAILKGRLYTSMPGRSGAVMTISSVVGIIGSIVPLLIGLAADYFGLRHAMWVLILGPVALTIGLPRKGKR